MDKVRFFESQTDIFLEKKVSENKLKVPQGISFIKSPSLFLLDPITLSYEYDSLTSSMPRASKDIFSTISEIQTSSLKHYHRLNTDFLTWSKRLEQWKKSTEERNLFKARRLAPGYLDTKQRMLHPIPAKRPSTIS
ncbi:hypothetical protein PORY_001090 [Pneumocystis oryctolagi]|uniref:Uncharacterized protein n=1 Tax=Pneumocystis oryctolagi TaxID=42067 RepID=A0ACB7CF66_9ASCO|nr:hypothetical protein PORY_001090 [Pneumocystis oryctolagi]